MYAFKTAEHGSTFKDRTGQTYGRLIAIEYYGNRRWLCKCSCGALVEVLTQHLRSGHTKSCGCLKRGKK